MNKGQKETLTTRIVSTTFVVIALAVFKPFGLEALQWQAYLHLAVILVIGFVVCMITDVILKYVVKMPRAYDKGVGYIISRNLRFQLINTPLVALAICLYRHVMLTGRVESNRLSWANFFETLVIIGFCSFAIGLYWRFKFRSRFLEAELEETRLLNEQLQRLQSLSPVPKADDIADHKDEKENGPSQAQTIRAEEKAVLKGTTSETVTLKIENLLYIEAVGNYVKVCQLIDGKEHSDMLRATSKQMESDLKSFPMIVRCHRAFLVNLQQVEKIVSKSGTMQLLMKHCSESLPVSRSNMAQIKVALSPAPDVARSVPTR
ncbi:MAG: LytTR family transcriptional regulator DNA-binding domain-containing protein [Prevotella sp.]|nr:LytTR family transcriptional regulator DNA-binding domain-containing protein [Prevotella sp.]